MLESDEEYTEQLQKLNDKGVSFNSFWNAKLYSEYIFVSDKEHTQANAIWTQAVLETIFDEKYLSPKIDTDFVDIWIQKLNAKNNEN
ncbi:16345_t:CDS:2, partial [Racocetra persica]